MRGLIQRVKQASVSITLPVESAEAQCKTVGEISQGVVLFLGVQKNDNFQKADKLLKKSLITGFSLIKKKR